MWRLPFLRPLVGIICILGASSCNNSSGASSGAPASGRKPAPEDMPTAIAVESGNVAIGFYDSKKRDTTRVSGFTITQSPVTVKEYRVCMVAGACKEPLDAQRCASKETTSILQGPTLGAPDGDALPVTCVTAEQAAAYCSWVGGTLPTLPQWLFAARGAEVHRYPWGDSHPTCERHPAVPGLLATQLSCCRNNPDCDLSSLGRVRTHPQGASSAGLQDVLLTPAELLRVSENAGIGACEGTSGACMVRGSHAAITSVEGLAADSSNQASHMIPASFRCVFEETSR